MINIHKIYFKVLKFLVISSPALICLFPLLYDIKLFLDMELVTEEDWLATTLIIRLLLFSELNDFCSINSSVKLFILSFLERVILIFFV